MKVSIEQFLAEKEIPVLDVRSPAEYERGHIPGAFSFPIFTNEERHKIGYAYTKRSKEEAVDLGFDFIFPKLDQFVEQARSIAINNKLRVHCWRGGMRSESLAWFLEQNGLKCLVLENGYKAFRHYVQEYFKRDLKLIIIGGKTGCGKTEILKQISQQGEQVIDLENLANHRGSVFGAFEGKAQPSSEHFENLLFNELVHFDLNRPIFIESESIRMGNVFIPHDFYQKFLSASVIWLELDVESRVQRILNEYGNSSSESLLNALERIKKRMGFDNFQHARNSILQRNLKKAIYCILEYYDKVYDVKLLNEKGLFVNLQENKQNASQIINLARNNGLLV
jgi:tRNA 2-selenouridine synthase